MEAIVSTVSPQIPNYFVVIERGRPHGIDCKLSSGEILKRRVSGQSNACCDKLKLLVSYKLTSRCTVDQLSNWML